MALHTTLAISIQNIAQRRPADLDERQRAAREQAYVLAQRVLAWVLTLLWIYATMAWLTHRWLPQGQQLWALLWALVLLAHGLPTSIAAWLEPEPVAEEQLPEV